MVSLRFNSLARFLLPSFRSKRNLMKDVIFCKGSSCRHFSSIAELSDLECDQVCDDGDAKEKDSALRLALTQLAGEFGRESMLSLHRFFSSRRAPVISTGSLKLDLALGIGGLPKGRMVEIYGKEASGKTTLALHIIKEAQRHGGYCAYLDAENAMDPSLAESMGVDIDKLLISPPDSAENLLSMVDTLTQSGSIDVIVVDSVAALVPQREIESTSVGTYPDVQSRIMTQALRKIHSSLCQSRTLIVFLNQVRSGPSKSGKNSGLTEEVTCGGNALKFYSAVRLRMIRTGLLKTNDKVIGVGIRVQVMKNKLSLAMDKTDIKIKFGQGFFSASEVFELACEHGVITREGNNYFIEGDFISNEHEAEQYLEENVEVLDRIDATLRQKLLESKKPSF